MKLQSMGKALNAGLSLLLVMRFGCDKIAQIGRSVASARRGPLQQHATATVATRNAEGRPPRLELAGCHRRGSILLA